MTSGLIYLPRDSEKLPALEYVKDAIRALQTSTMERFAKTVSNVNLKMLTVLAKRHILDSWLGPECASAVDTTSS